jgi:cellulose synthase/poly-beta-1,6-N-acetylglucosamine synthase-like glycosyltransferase
MPNAGFANIGLPFIQVDQTVLPTYVLTESKIEYWSECHVSEDFELMIHLYNLGFNGRYCAYPDREFEEGITRTFDEEASRHQSFASERTSWSLIHSRICSVMVSLHRFRRSWRVTFPLLQDFLNGVPCSYTSVVPILYFHYRLIAWLLMVNQMSPSLYALPAGIIV